MNAPLDPDSQDQLPRWFGDYVLLKKIGRGGMGQVYLARLPGLAGIDRLCVIKTLRSQWTNDREYVARFVDEARVVVQLNHRNICPVFDVGQVGRTYYLAMDLVHGRDLQAVLERVRGLEVPLPIDLSLFIVGEVLEALDAAHRLRDPETDAPLNLVHRDVSPHNVLVSFDGEVKLIDFGLAQSELKQERTEPGVVLGKMAYMAPEHARGDVVDLRADVFAAGVLLYEMAVGERYWHGKSVAEIWQMVGHGAHRPSRLADLPEPVQDVIEKATAPSLKERYRSGADMKAAITRVQIARGVVAGSADLREQMAHLFGDEAAADRRERAALQKLPAPGTVVESGSGSTRIARAPGPPSSASSPALPSAASTPPPAAPGPSPTMTVSTSMARPSSSTPAAPVVPVVPAAPASAAPAKPSLQVRSSSPLVSVTDEIRVVRPTEDQIHTDVGLRRRSSPSPSTSPTSLAGLDPSAPVAPSRLRLALVVGVVAVVAAIGLWSLLGGPVSPVPVPSAVVVAGPVSPPVPVAPPPVVTPPPAPVAAQDVVTPPPAPVAAPPVVAPAPPVAAPPAPPSPPAPGPVVKPAPPAPAPVAPWPSRLPGQPGPRLDLLQARCPRLGCTVTLSRAPSPMSMTTEQLSQHQQSLAACLEVCRQTAP